MSHIQFLNSFNKTPQTDSLKHIINCYGQQPTTGKKLNSKLNEDDTAKKKYTTGTETVRITGSTIGSSYMMTEE